MYSQEQMQNGASSTSPDQPRLGVDRVPRLESAEFAARYFRPRQPVVITDMATQWPACQRWSFDFFAQLDPDRAVTLEKGNVLQDETAFESARMADYLTGLTQAGHAVSGAEDE